MANIVTDTKKKSVYPTEIKKRSMINFTAEKWMAVLESKQWNLVNSEATGVNGFKIISRKARFTLN